MTEKRQRQAGETVKEDLTNKQAEINGTYMLENGRLYVCMCANRLWGGGRTTP